MRKRYGPPEILQFTDAREPTPTDNEVLIRVFASAVNPLDLYLLKGMPWNRVPGLNKPECEILGCDISGRVEAVGKNVTQFQVGSEVFGATGFAGSGFAEYACVPEEKIVLKPEKLTFEEAAAIPIAGSTALQALRDKGQIKPGCKVLVEGASGGVGTFCTQLAKVFGAEVTAVCAARNIERARNLGADRALDYTQTNFTRSIERYDLILGVNAHHPVIDYRRVLSRQGRYVAIGGSLSRVLEALLLGTLLSQFGSKKSNFFVANINRKDLTLLADLAATGQITAVIDRQYPLNEAAEALRYLGEGHAKGKIVLTVST